MPPLLWASDNTIVVEADWNLLDVRYGYYALIQAQLTRHAGGAAQPLITQTVLRNVEIPVPTLQTQRRIAGILSAYDDLIEVNARRIAILEEMARRLFDEWITKKLGRLPIPGDRLNEWTLPRRWQFERLVDRATITMGQSPPSHTYNSENRGLPFHQGVSDFEGFFHANRIFVDGVFRPRLAKAGDILFSVRAPVARIALALNDMVLGRGLASIRPAESYASYILCHLRATFPRPDAIGNGAIYKAVTKDDVLSIPIVWPGDNVVENFGRHAQPIWSLIRSLHISNINLRASRDLLLPKLISGEIDVAGAEREIVSTLKKAAAE